MIKQENHNNHNKKDKRKRQQEPERGDELAASDVIRFAGIAAAADMFNNLHFIISLEAK